MEGITRDELTQIESSKKVKSLQLWGNLVG
jgi:hypothetical protein